MNFLNTWLTITDFHCYTNKMIRSRDGGTGAGGGGQGGPQIFADQKMAAAASARHITTRHHIFSDHPPSLRSSHKIIPSSYWAILAINISSVFLFRPGVSKISLILSKKNQWASRKMFCKLT